MRRMAIHQVVHSNNSHDRNDFCMIFGGFKNRFARLRQYIKWCIQHISKNRKSKMRACSVRRDKTFLKVISSLFLLTTLFLWLFGNILTSFYIFFLIFVICYFYGFLLFSGFGLFVYFGDFFLFVLYLTFFVRV